MARGGAERDGPPASSRDEEPRKDPALEPPEGAQRCWHLDRWLLASGGERIASGCSEAPCLWYCVLSGAAGGLGEAQLGGQKEAAEGDRWKRLQEESGQRPGERRAEGVPRKGSFKGCGRVAGRGQWGHSQS